MPWVPWVSWACLGQPGSHLGHPGSQVVFPDVVRGQGANTRARNAINGVQAKIDATSEEYSVAYEALLSLSVLLLEYSWKEELHPLMPSDIRDLSEGKEGESEGKRTISWIWRTISNSPTTGKSDFLQDRKFSLSLKSSS